MPVEPAVLPAGTLVSGELMFEVAQEGERDWQAVRGTVTLVTADSDTQILQQGGVCGGIGVVVGEV